jgi:hypothetical protein
VGFAAFFLATVAGIAAIRRYRNRQFAPGYRFVFDDLPDPAVRTLEISHGVKYDHVAALRQE